MAAAKARTWGDGGAAMMTSGVVVDSALAEEIDDSVTVGRVRWWANVQGPGGEGLVYQQQDGFVPWPLGSLLSRD